MKLEIVTNGSQADAEHFTFDITFPDPVFPSATLPFASTTASSTKRRIQVRYPQYVSNPQRSAIALDPALWKNVVVDECLFVLQDKGKDGGSTIKVVLVDEETKEWGMDRTCEIKVRSLLAYMARSQQVQDVTMGPVVPAKGTALSAPVDTTDTMEGGSAYSDVSSGLCAHSRQTEPSSKPATETTYTFAKSRILDIFYRHVLLPHLSSSSNFAGSHAHWSNQSQLRQCEKDMSNLEEDIAKANERLKNMVERSTPASAIDANEDANEEATPTEEDGRVPQMDEDRVALDLDIMDIGWSLDRSILAGAKALDSPSPPSSTSHLDYSCTQPITRSKPPPFVVVPTLRRAPAPPGTADQQSSPTLSPTSPTLLPASPVRPPKRSRLRNSPQRPASDTAIALQTEQVKALQARHASLIEYRDRLLFDLELIEQEAQQRRQKEADSVEIRRGIRGRPVVDQHLDQKPVAAGTTSPNRVARDEVAAGKEEKVVSWNHWDDAEELNRKYPPTPPSKARGMVMLPAVEAIARAEEKRQSDASLAPSFLVVLKRRKGSVISGESGGDQANESPRTVLGAKRNDKEKDRVKVKGTMVSSPARKPGKENELAEPQAENSGVFVVNERMVMEDRLENVFLSNESDATDSAREHKNGCDVPVTGGGDIDGVAKENAGAREHREGGKNHVSPSAVTIKTSITTKVTRIGTGSTSTTTSSQRTHATAATAAAAAAATTSGKEYRTPPQSPVRQQRRSRSSATDDEPGDRRRRSLVSTPGASNSRPILARSNSMPTARLLRYRNFDEGEDEQVQASGDEDEDEDEEDAHREPYNNGLAIPSSPTKRKRGLSLSSSSTAGVIKASKSEAEVMSDHEFEEMERVIKEACKCVTCVAEKRDRKAGVKGRAARAAKPEDADVEMAEVERRLLGREAPVEEKGPQPDRKDTPPSSYAEMTRDVAVVNEVSDDGFFARILAPLSLASSAHGDRSLVTAWKSLSEIQHEGSAAGQDEEGNGAEWLRGIGMRSIAKAIGM